MSAPAVDQRKSKISAFDPHSIRTSRHSNTPAFEHSGIRPPQHSNTANSRSPLHSNTPTFENAARPGLWMGKRIDTPIPRAVLKRFWDRYGTFMGPLWDQTATLLRPVRPQYRNGSRDRSGTIAGAVLRPFLGPFWYRSGTVSGTFLGSLLVPF